MNPLSADFWRDEIERLTPIMATLFTEILTLGASVGSEILQLQGFIGVSWDIINEAVVAIGKSEAAIFTEYLEKSIADVLSERIPAWIERGESLPELIKELEPLFAPGRGEAIAITETTRLYALGNIKAWDASGVVKGKTWKVVGDSKTCDVCAGIAKNTPTVPLLSEGFEIRELDEETNTYKVIQTINAPPAHPRCRCALRPQVT
jgi:hypothetical protein